MKKKHTYQIYALVADKKVFVGKTKSHNLKPIRWQHLRGENRYTKAYFSRSLSVDLQMYPLVQIRADSSIAYRYIVAFVRMFRDEGYTVLNCTGITEDAQDIHPVTQTILSRLSSMPLRFYLRNGLGSTDAVSKECRNPEGSYGKKRAQSKQPMASEKLTIRVTPNEKKWLTDFAKNLGISQRQALLILLAMHKNADRAEEDWSFDAYIQQLLATHREAILRLEEEIDALQKRLEAIRKEIVECKAREAFQKQGILTFFKLVEPSHSDNPPLEQGIYKLFLKDLADPERYRFPEEEGFFLFYPEKILLGKGTFAPLFIAGSDDQGVKTVLRYYRKEAHIGFSFTNSKFGVQDSVWLVGVKRAKDNAMDVLFSLPVDIQRHECEQTRDSWEADVDALIAEATRRSEREGFLCY